jgi:hypothetical protein
MQAAEYDAAFARAVADDNARASAVFISGATGSNASNINGFFEPSEEKGADGRILYTKRGDASKIIVHFCGTWQILPVSSRDTGGCWAHTGGSCALEACVAAVWKVISVSGGDFHEQESLKMATGAEAEAQVSSLNALVHPHNPPPAPLPPCALPSMLCPLTRFAKRFAAQAAAFARAVADDNARASAVFISGATGPNAKIAYGLFEPTEEKGADGRILYTKRGDASKIIEHFDGRWQIKYAQNKSKNSCFASVGGCCSLEARAGDVWRVVVSGVFQDQENVKMVTGAEAEAQVSRLLHPHNPPPALLPPCALPSMLCPLTRFDLI